MVTAPNVVGLDLSLTATGIAAAGVADVLRPKGLTGPERLAWLCDRVDAIVKLHNAALVVVEGYAYGRQNTAHQLGELGGVIRLALWEAGIPYVDVPPSTLKKYATGRGNAGKEEVLAAAIRRLGYQGHDNNEADALWLRALGCAAYGAPLADLPKLHASVVDGLDWPEIGEL